MYRTARDAKTAIKIFNDENEGVKGVKKLKGFYFCEHCDRYHITSMSKSDKDKRDWRVKTANKWKKKPKNIDEALSLRLEELKSKNKVK